MATVDVQQQNAQSLRHAALRAEVGAAFARGGTLEEVLARCAHGVAAQLDALVVRVWLLDAPAGRLELVADAGPARDGGLNRAPVALGEGRVGEVAATQVPRISPVFAISTDDERAFAARHDGVCFSGFPLVVERRLVGVLSVFTALRPDAELQEAMSTACDLIAQGVERLRTVEALRMSEARLRLLVDASTVLSSSLDYEQTLRSVAKLVVPGMADWCSIHLTEGEAHIPRELVTAHVDPRKVEWARELGRRYPADPTASTGAFAVIRTGQAELYRELSAEVVERSARDAEHLRIIREVGMKSAMIVPLTARGRTFGAISFVSAESGRHYDEQDLAMARELADRAAYAVDNARLYRDAQDAVRVRDDFLAIASHELKTPLTPLHLHLESIRRLSVQDPVELGTPRIAAKLETMARQVNRLEKLVNGLLEIGRVAGGRMELSCEAFDLSELVSEVADRFRSADPRSPPQIDVDVEGDLTGCWDRLRMVQIVSNLLGNAVKFGEGRPVRLTAKAVGDRVRVRVSDLGIGISAEDQARIFERFERAVPTRHYGGFGLGLWLVKQLVDAMGGTVDVASRPGEGSTFTVELPRRPIALDEDPRPPH